ncbi:MAG: hypothetical protein BGO01_00125 [Armatimonadetes bacterium 55-13]|nr:hypothetical protein [Armatimonadota bacterium]OJU63107.1 MAG: hypothetical protein BGO01_00125 [Armatimonadetes bacterium 55-13]
MKKLGLLILPLVVLLAAGCSQQQDIGDAAKPPPAGAQPPGAVGAQGGASGPAPMGTAEPK